jgi:hypothetical protein
MKKVKKISPAAVIAAAENGAKNRKFFQNIYFSQIKFSKNSRFFSHSKTTNDNLRKNLGF